jgi:hypothetical protein
VKWIQFISLWLMFLLAFWAYRNFDRYQQVMVFLLLAVIVLLRYILARMSLLLTQLRDLRDAFFAVHDLEKVSAKDPDDCFVRRRKEPSLEPPLFYPCVCDEIAAGMCDEHIPPVVCPIHGKQARRFLRTLPKT